MVASNGTPSELGSMAGSVGLIVTAMAVVAPTVGVWVGVRVGGGCTAGEVVGSIVVAGSAVMVAVGGAGVLRTVGTRVCRCAAELAKLSTKPKRGSGVWALAEWVSKDKQITKTSAILG